MAPKASKPREPEVTLDEEAQAELDESNRLQTLCYDHGVSPAETLLPKSEAPSRPVQQ